MTATAHDTRPPGHPPIRTPFYYGWVLVVVSFITGAIGNGVAFWAVGALAVPITADMGWSRSMFFGAMTVRNILSGVVAPVVGPMQDTRDGPPRLMLAASLMLGVGIMGLAFMQELWHLYLLYGVLGALSIIGTNDMLSNAIRFLAIDAIVRAGEGHQGVPLGMAEIATALYTEHLKFDAADPAWPDRDRVVLSNGHGSMLLFSLLYLTGYRAIPIDQIKSFRELGSHCEDRKSTRLNSSH